MKNDLKPIIIGRKQKTCPSCGSNFSCEPEEDCWCEAANIHRKEMLLLLSEYNDCICPDCLAKYSE